MIQVKVKAKNFRLSIPVPYAVVYTAVSVLSSEQLQKSMTKWTKNNVDKEKADFTWRTIDRTQLLSIVKEMKKHKGCTLVDLKVNDGTEVKVRL